MMERRLWWFFHYTGIQWMVSGFFVGCGFILCGLASGLRGFGEWLTWVIHVVIRDFGELLYRKGVAVGRVHVVALTPEPVVTYTYQPMLDTAVNHAPDAVPPTPEPSLFSGLPVFVDPTPDDGWETVAGYAGNLVWNLTKSQRSIPDLTDREFSVFWFGVENMARAVTMHQVYQDVAAIAARKSWRYKERGSG